DRGISPQVVEWHRKGAHVNDIFALLSHRLREGFYVQFTIFFIVDHFDVPHRTLLTRRFVSNDRNSSFFGAIKNRLKSLGVIWHHSDQLHFLGDQVLDGAYLLGRIGGCRTNHISIVIIFLSSLLDALFHGVEPGYTADLDYDRDLFAGRKHLISNC